MKASNLIYLCPKFIVLETLKPYGQAGESKKKEVQKMFDNIAGSYDMLNAVLSFGMDSYWRKKAIHQFPDATLPLRVLDVACGTGDMCLQAFRYYPSYRYLGVDLSAGMLQVGRNRIGKLKLADKISMEQGDCENLHYDEASFDLVMAAFGVRNFENLDAGLQHMHRVLQSGGKVIILEFSRPRIFPFKQLYNFYFRNILPLVGRFGSKDANAYKYLYESVQQFPDYERFTDRLTACGFSNCTITPLTFGICCVYTGIKI